MSELSFGSRTIKSSTVAPQKASVLTANAAAGALPFIIQINAPGAATGNVDVTMTIKAKVVAAWALLEGAGTTSDTLQLKSGTTNAITEALDIATSLDHDKVDFASFDNAYATLAVGGVLRLAQVDGGGTDAPAASVYVMLVPLP